MAGRDEHFKHRWDYALRDGASHRRYLIDLVDELLEIEAATHPSEGPCPDKNELSIDAFMVAGRLLERSIGWAIDHRVGLVLNDVPFSDPEASDHAHEGKAGEYGAMDDDFQIDRRMLRLLLATQQQTLPLELWGKVLDALGTLEMGKPSAFFDPKVREPIVRDRLRELRLKALEHLEFRRGMNIEREKAKGDIAEAYDIDADTLDKWSTRLNQGPLGKSGAEEIRRFARSRGRDAFEQLQNGDNALVAEEAAALQRDGAAFQKLAGTTDGKVVQFPE